MTVTYYARAFDTGGTNRWVYWTTQDLAATPLATDTSPNYTGTLTSKMVVYSFESAVIVAGSTVQAYKNFGGQTTGVILKPLSGIKTVSVAFSSSDCLVFSGSVVRV